MHLCDFAAHVAECPNGPNCLGPGGEPFQTAGSLYPYDIFNTRKFAVGALQAIFPERREETGNTMDPGEYGIESYYCRLICIFIFMLSIADEFQNILGLMKLLYQLPTENGKWVKYEYPTWASKNHVKHVRGISELEFVSFAVNGMPLRWKIFNVLFLLLPKLFIWRMLTKAGIQFLMETAAIVDQIVNTTALTFVFTCDELIMDRLSTYATKHIMSNLEDYELFDSDPYEDESDRAALERYRRKEVGFSLGSGEWWLLPRRLIWSFVLMALFLAEYYIHNCNRTGDGSLVSVDMFYPTAAHLDPWCFLAKTLAYSCETEGEAFWSMPHARGNSSD